MGKTVRTAQPIVARLGRVSDACSRGWIESSQQVGWKVATPLSCAQAHSLSRDRPLREIVAAHRWLPSRACLTTGRVSAIPLVGVLRSKLLADSIGIGKRAKNRHTYLRFVSGFDREEKSVSRFSLVRELFGKATYHLLVATATKARKF
jgi:hypothetical protein